MGDKGDTPSLDARSRVRHWSRGRRRALMAGALLLAVLVVLDQRGLLLAPRNDDLQMYDHQLARVVRVIDGALLEIGIRDRHTGRRATRVALWGVSEPKSIENEARAAALAAHAIRFLEQLTHNGPVRLRLEPHRTRNASGHLLAHVELADGRSLNEEMLREGLAAADEDHPHTMLLRYAQLELLARRRRVGIWAADDS